MNNFTDLIDRYIAVWNETDDARRRALIAQTWTNTARYRDPLMQGDGHAGIDAMVQAVQERFPGHRFHRIGAIDALHEHVRFAWELGAADEPAVVCGTDFGTVADDGRLQTVIGFLDPVAAAQTATVRA